MNEQTALKFDNSFIRVLPGDGEQKNYSRQVHGAFYSMVKPEIPSDPQYVIHSEELRKELGLAQEFCQSKLFTEIFSGAKSLGGMQPFATCYGGHQFGHWAGQLGDGRAINLGEVLVNDKRFWLQLKGAGPTPYSRSADGYAVLRSSVREFLCSEAMFHLGVPTTRALSLVLTGDQVWRDMFYNGNGADEPGAVVCRVAPSFTRFGHFELPSSRGDEALLKQIVDYTITYDFSSQYPLNQEGYLEWYREICRRTAHLMVHWMRVGFVHGVMNTDNMSILGLTIDYGPYGWIDQFDLNWTPNTTDGEGRRYCFGRQPQIAGWNLAQLANGLYPLILDGNLLQDALNEYANAFEIQYQKMCLDKLGLLSVVDEREKSLVDILPQLLQRGQFDMTLFYRDLMSFDGQVLPKENWKSHFIHSLYDENVWSGDFEKEMSNWLAHYHQCIQLQGQNKKSRLKQMGGVNPVYVLRNYLAQEAIEKATEGDFSRIHQLLDLLKRPYEVQEGGEAFSKKRPDWAKNKAGCSMLSCSS